MRSTISNAINAFVLIPISPRAEALAALFERPPNRLRRRISIAGESIAVPVAPALPAVPVFPNQLAVVQNRRMSVADFRSSSQTSNIVPVVPAVPMDTSGGNESLENVEMVDVMEVEPMDVDT